MLALACKLYKNASGTGSATTTDSDSKASLADVEIKFCEQYAPSPVEDTKYPKVPCIIPKP